MKITRIEATHASRVGDVEQQYSVTAWVEFEPDEAADLDADEPPEVGAIASIVTGLLVSVEAHEARVAPPVSRRK